MSSKETPFSFAFCYGDLVSDCGDREKCPNLVLNEWYLDDGVLAGRHVDVLRA